MVCATPQCEKCSQDILDVLFAISEAFSQSLELHHALGFVLKAMAEHMGMLRGTITILNRETEKISIEEAYGLSASQQARGRYKLGEGITGKVVQTGKTMVVPKIAENPLFLDKTHARKLLDKKDISFICVPIKLGPEVIGTLSADRLFDEHISLEEDERMLSIIAAMIAHAVSIRQKANEKIDYLREENQRLHDELKDRFLPENIIGKSNAIKNVYALISNVLKTNTTVLIRGESGVGKELVAHAIHYNSLRSRGPFIKVNCSAIPDNLIESELFGHEKGAFTGAFAARKGKFEAADTGTIFLDEIGDLPMSTQVKLLRVLQERELERLGSNRTIKIDVRIVAATNRDLEQLVQERKFREDLYYRLNVFPIHVPPLRERQSDITLLANYFVEKFSKEQNKVINSLSNSFISTLMDYPWPGNVRELENCMERAVLLCHDGVLRPFHLPSTLQQSIIPEESPQNESLLERQLNRVEKEFLIDALKQATGNISKAAKILGVTERIMGLRIKKFEIEPRVFKKNKISNYEPKAHNCR